MAKHELSYQSMEQGNKDGWKEIGGVAELLRMVKQGWYAVCERKEQNDKNTAIREMVKNDPRLKSIREQAKAKVKAAREAGKK
jgi:hypothetical protein